MIFSPYKKEISGVQGKSANNFPSSRRLDPAAFRSHLVEQLANSLTAPMPEMTERRVFGRVAFPGKATAVVGVRRAARLRFSTRSGEC